MIMIVCFLFSSYARWLCHSSDPCDELVLIVEWEDAVLNVDTDVDLRIEVRRNGDFVLVSNSLVMGLAMDVGNNVDFELSLLVRSTDLSGGAVNCWPSPTELLCPLLHLLNSSKPMPVRAIKTPIDPCLLNEWPSLA